MFHVCKISRSATKSLCCVPRVWGPIKLGSLKEPLGGFDVTAAPRATRGKIRILDTAKLEAIAGGSYGVPEHEYERLIGISFRRS